jgi:FMN-dependent NADH-azoreductase
MGGRSVSRHLSAKYAEHWKKAHPSAKVITRDLTTTPLIPVNQAWIGAAYTPADARTAEQKEALALSDELIAELFEADEYVIGVPMYNFGVPGLFKEWIDQIARVNVTFSYATGAPEGLLKGKKATVLIAAAGTYDLGTAAEGMNHVEPYLKTVLGFLGVTDVTFHTAGGGAALNYGADRDAYLAPHDLAVAELAAA